MTKQICPVCRQAADIQYFHLTICSRCLRLERKYAKITRWLWAETARKYLNGRQHARQGRS
jgi:hypothetical protein